MSVSAPDDEQLSLPEAGRQRTSMRWIIAAVLPLAAAGLFALCGCATKPRYELSNGATLADGMRAVADCRAEAVAEYPQTVALGNPLFGLAAITTANVWQTYIDDCMGARGFHLCRTADCRAPPTS
jgi:hypothetical protein